MRSSSFNFLCSIRLSVRHSGIRSTPLTFQADPLLASWRLSRPLWLRHGLIKCVLRRWMTFTGILHRSRNGIDVRQGTRGYNSPQSSSMWFSIIRKDFLQPISPKRGVSEQKIPAKKTEWFHLEWSHREPGTNLTFSVQPVTQIQFSRLSPFIQFVGYVVYKAYSIDWNKLPFSHQILFLTSSR